MWEAGLGTGVRRKSLWFAGPYRVEVREEEVPGPGPGQLLVKAIRSGISAGTEVLIYRGDAPEGMAADESIPALKGAIEFPMKYGYALVGEVAETGSRVPKTWQGATVFSFHPHEDLFLAEPEEVVLLPPGIGSEEALLFPAMETALTLVMDGAPLLGEQIAVFGQGVIGLLVTALLARLSPASLVAADCFPLRRAASRKMGAHAALEPSGQGFEEQALSLLEGNRPVRGADLAFEVSGSPNALNQAIAVTGFGGRIVIGSWYGKKPVAAALGGSFHRSRIRLMSSQVSTLAPERTGRWDKERVRNLAWQTLREIKPSGLITHRFPLSQAHRAYDLLARDPGEMLQVVFTYE